jgi:MoaA/NifB/PqqE/SkfB family radical SAM enzyme
MIEGERLIVENMYTLMGKKNLKDKVRSLYKKIFPKVSIIFFPTFFCNYHCPYCEYDAQEFFKMFPHSVEHTWEEWVNAFSQFPHATISISGGETLSYKGIIPLINALQEKHTVGLTTNVSLLSDDFLTHARKDISISVSFHPHTVEVEQLLPAVIELKNHGFKKVSVNFVAYPDKIHLLPELTSLFREKEIPLHVEALIHPEIRYSEEEERTVRNYTKSIHYGFTASLESKKCLGGSKHFAIVPNGDVYTCAVGIYYGTCSPLYKIFKPRKEDFFLGNLFDHTFNKLRSPKMCSLPCSAACDNSGAQVEIINRNR